MPSQAPSPPAEKCAVIGYLGTLRAGCIAVPLNHLLAPADLTRQLEFADVKCCLAGEIDDERRGAAW